MKALKYATLSQPHNSLLVRKRCELRETLEEKP